MKILISVPMVRALTACCLGFKFNSPLDWVYSNCLGNSEDCMTCYFNMANSCKLLNFNQHDTKVINYLQK